MEGQRDNQTPLPQNYAVKHSYDAVGLLIRSKRPTNRGLMERDRTPGLAPPFRLEMDLERRGYSVPGRNARPSRFAFCARIAPSPKAVLALVVLGLLPFGSATAQKPTAPTQTQSPSEVSPGSNHPAAAQPETKPSDAGGGTLKPPQAQTMTAPTESLGLAPSSGAPPSKPSTAAENAPKTQAASSDTLSVRGDSGGEKPASNSAKIDSHGARRLALLIAAIFLGMGIFALDLKKRFESQLGLGVYYNWYCFGFLAATAVCAVLAYMCLESLTGMFGTLGTLLTTSEKAKKLSEVYSAGFMDVFRVIGSGGGPRLFLAFIGRLLPPSRPSPKAPGDDQTYDYGRVVNLVFDFVYAGINEHVKDKRYQVAESLALKHDWGTIQNRMCWLLKDEIQNGGLAEDAGRKAIAEISGLAANGGPNDDRERKEYALRTAMAKTSYSLVKKRLAREPVVVTT